MGYKKVYTFDQEVEAYYYKQDVSTWVDAQVGSSAKGFADKLHEHGSLYIKVLNENGEWVDKAPGYEPEVGITTIEEYYSWIKNLGSIDRKYTILPLDEEHFSINANTRAITVPVDFKKNGIAVQGDEIAEIVYFKIDRYFDYMDFNNADIFIQWEAPKGKDGVVVKGFSREYVRDIESEPGKLIFGWVLSDAITKNSGTLKFSVRFVQFREDEELEYSFSTLTASALIQPGLNYDLAKDETLYVDDIGERVIERLENSVVVGGYIAGEPEFIWNLEDIADLEASGLLNLQVLAESADAGEVSYQWKKEFIRQEAESKDGKEPEGAIKTLTGKNVFTPVAIEDIELGRTYYYFRNDQPNVPYLYDGAFEDLPNFEYKDTLAIKASECEVDSVGKYWVVALNRVGSSMCEEKSAVCVIPRPLPVEGIVNPEAKVILPSDDVVILSAGAANTDGVLSYVWYKDENKALNFDETAPNWVELEETSSTLIVNEEGHYKAKVINTRNKETEEAETEMSRVTFAAAAPVLVETLEAERQYNDSALTDENCFEVQIDAEQAVYSDQYTVQWFKWVEDGGSYAVSEDLVDQFKFNPGNIEESVFEENNDEQNIWGKYYAVITNYVNGSVAKVESEQYIVY